MKNLKSYVLSGAILCVALTVQCPSLGAETPKPAGVKELVAILQSGAPEKEKADACRELGRIGTAEAIAPLAALLADEKLSHMARYGLEPIPDPAVDQVFRNSLSKLQGRQLVGVIHSIGVRRDTKAISALGDLLKASDPDVVQAAARSLGTISKPAAGRALEKALPSAAAANRLAIQEGLLRCADTFYANKRLSAARDIYLLLRKSEGPQQVRAASVRGSLLATQKGATDMLAKDLTDEDWVVFGAALRASSEMPGVQITKAMATQLSKLPAPRQIVVAQTLGNRGCCCASDALLALAKGGETPARLAAVRALAQIGAAGCGGAQSALVPPLRELMDDTNKEIAGAAQEALASLPGQAAEEAIMVMLQSAQPPQVRTGVDMAVRRRMHSAVPELLALAGKGDGETRSAAFRGVGDLGNIENIDSLSALLLKSDAKDREAAERALGTLCGRVGNAEQCSTRLQTQMEKAAVTYKPVFLRVLGSLGGATALKTVKGSLNDSSSEVRGVAVRTLANWPSADAAPDLLQLAKGAPEASEKQIGLRGYLRFAGQGELPANDRLAMCREAAALVQKDDEKKLLLGALGGISSIEAVDQIKPYLEDAAVKEEASMAVINVSEKILAGPNAAGAAPKLIEPLQKAGESTGNADLKKKAEGLVEQARKKA